jgi:phage FluMu protein gp41
MMSVMAKPERSATTVYLDRRIARAAKVKAALTGRSLSDLTNEGLTRLLSEDERDLRLAKQRRKERGRPYEEFLKDLRRDGLL